MGLAVVVVSLLAGALVNYASVSLAPFAVSVPPPARAPDDLIGAPRWVYPAEVADLPPFLFGDPDIDYPDLRHCRIQRGHDVLPFDCERPRATASSATVDLADDAGPSAVSDVGCTPVRLPLVLVGTQVDAARDWSLAVVRRADTGETRIVSVGDTLDDDVVVDRIDRAMITVRRDDELECLQVGATPASMADDAGAAPNEVVPRDMGPGASRSVSADTVQDAPEPDPLDDAIRRNDDGSITLDRGFIAELVQGSPPLDEIPRISVLDPDDRSPRVQVHDVRHGSIASRLGIRNGDVLVAIDGSSVHTPQQALALYDALIERDRVEVSVERRGRVQTLVYHLR